jgi:hypothetical protein
MNSPIALILDFDLTVSTEYQQFCIIRKYMKEYQAYYNTPEKIEEIQQYSPDFKGIHQPGDFFGLVHATREKVMKTNPNARVQNGITWMEQLMMDRKPGMPLESLTDQELEELIGSIEKIISKKK